MMRKTRKITALTLSVVMIMSLAFTQAFAADTKTVQVSGYTDEELQTTQPQLEITNVLSTLNLDKSLKISAKSIEGEDLWSSYEYINAAYNAAAPVTIKTLNDGAYFEVYKLDKDGNLFRFDSDKEIPYTSGKVLVENDDQPVKTIDYKDITEDDYVTTYLAGCTVTLTEPGSYYVEYRYDIFTDSTEVFINVGDDANANPTTPAKATAASNPSTISVDGTKLVFDAYMINDFNFIKLRDFAKAVNGSSKQFEVSFENGTIYLASRTPYTADGSELKAGDGKTKEATASTATVIQDGTEIGLTAYNIGGYTYFKLRDLARAFSIGVTYENNVIGIDTSVGYSE